MSFEVDTDDLDTKLLSLKMFPKFRINRTTLFYYIAHIFGSILALTILLLAFFIHKTELDNIGDFNINLSTSFVRLFYASAIFLILAIGVGYLAQQLSDKPSLWILYCILVSLISLVMLTASISTWSRARSNEAYKLLKQTIEFYVKGAPDSKKWDTLHEKFECCETKGYKDWQDVQFGRTSLHVPQSCYRPPNNTDDYCGLNVLPYDPKADERIYAQGCLKPALLEVTHDLYTLGILGLGVSVMHIILGIVSCYLLITKKI